MALPRDVATILGCTREDLARLQRPQRAIAFLRRPAGMLRVVGMGQSADLAGKGLTSKELVGIAHVTPTKLTFNIPVAVEVHMGLETYRRPGKDHLVTGADDPVAWVMPANEYYPYRRAVREGKPYVPPEGGAHLYFRKSVFPGLMPALDDIEGYPVDH